MTPGRNFDWHEYLSLARQLATSSVRLGSVEAVQRCAISRAYYAAFCLARNYSLGRGLTIKQGDNPHQVVAAHFLTSRDRQRQTVGEKLSRMRRRRNVADYNNSMKSPAKDARLNIREADSVASILKQLS